MKQAVSARSDSAEYPSVSLLLWNSLSQQGAGVTGTQKKIEGALFSDSPHRDCGEVSRVRPLFLNPVAAGFPSPADDYVERNLDLNEYLVRNPAATFFVRAQGESMLGAGIHDGDILVVDRSVQPSHNRVVIAAVHGELTVKRLWVRDGCVQLRPENSEYPPIDVTRVEQFEVWGVVTSVIHSL